MKLQKVASALLGALDLKTLGLNPPEFLEAIRGTYDATDHYLQNLVTDEQSIFTSVGPAPLGAGDGATLTVPNGFAWLLYGAGIAWQPEAWVADDVVHGAIRIRTNPSSGANVTVTGFTPWTVPTAWTTIAIASAYRVGVDFARPLLLGPGTLISGVNSFSLSGAPVVGDIFGLNARFAQIPL